MPIKPVTGRIESQEINDNLSYLESMFNKIEKNSPKGAFATLSDLQTAIPSGDNNIYVVSADGKWYYWSGTAWTAGGVFQGTSIANDTITRENLTERAKKTYPFQPNALLKYNRGDGVFVDIYTPKLKSIKDIRLINAKKGVRYYINRIWKLDASTYQIDIRETESNLYVCHANIPIASFSSGVFTVASLTQDSNSGISGSIVIRNSEFDTTSVDFTGMQSYDTAGLHDLCIQESIKLTQIAAEYDVVLPSVIPCVAGKQLDIHHENVLNNDYTKNYVFSLYANRTTNFYRNVDKLNWQPKEGDADAYVNYSFWLRSKYNAYSTTNRLVTVPANAGSGITKKAMIIGDSKTPPNDFLGELYNLFGSDVMSIELLGSLGTAPNLHEGRPGWGAYHYCKTQSYNVSTNAFWNPSTSKFDFSYYMAQKGFTSVDYVFIDLGANDTNLSKTDLLKYYDEMIASIKAYNSSIVVCVNLQEGACLAEVTDNQIYYQGKATLNKIVKNLIEKYDNRTAENIFVVPNYLNLDLYYDFNFTEEPVNYRNPKLVSKCTDPIHPSQYGYYKKADIYYYFIKYLANIGK